MNTQRGSFDWWAGICRQNTGSHFLDSGKHYGYHYERSIPEHALTVDMHDQKMEGVTVSTPHFLNELLDASGETVEALEELFLWVSNNVFADQSWLYCMEIFPLVLQELIAFGHPGSYTSDEEQRTDIESYLTQQMHAESNSTAPGLPDDWANTFPYSDLKHLAETYYGHHQSHGAANTYNHENDLDQVLQYVRFAIDGEQFILLQVHTGCDVRGGYTTPVVARMRDPDYFRMSWVSFWCPACSADYNTVYRLTKDLSESDEPDISGVGLEEGFYEVDALEASLRCPQCGEYTLQPWTPAWGF
jgi:hypothetical protein